MYRRGFSFLNHAFVLCFFLCLPLLFCAVNVWGPSLAVDPRVLRPFAFLGGYWLAFFHYSAYAGILYLVLRVVGLLGGNGAFWQQAYTLYAKAAFVAVMAILVYGAWNALHPVVRTMEHDTGKHLSQPVKIVLVTDIHLGSLFGRQYAAELTALINRQNADVVLFGGDQVDNDLGYLLREKSYEPLRNIKSKHGVYAILGNHDHFSGRVQEDNSALNNIPDEEKDAIEQEYISALKEVCRRNDASLTTVELYNDCLHVEINTANEKKNDVEKFECGIDTAVDRLTPADTKIELNHGYSSVKDWTIDKN